MAEPGQELGPLLIGEVALAGAHPLLEPFLVGAMGQQVGVVVALQDEALAARQTVGHQAGGQAQVGGQPQAGRPGLDHQAHRVGGVVADGEGAQADPPHREGLSRREGLVAGLGQGGVLGQRRPPGGGGGQDRHPEPLGQDPGPGPGGRGARG